MTVRIGWVLALTLGALAGGFALAGVVDAPAGTAAATGNAVAQLRAELAFERSAREALATQVARLEADLAALRGPEPASEAALAAAAAAAGGEAPAAEPPADDVAEAPAPSPDQAWFDADRLAKAGLSERDAADLKRIFEETELDRLYLRDQATREGWPDGRLARELAQLDEKMTSVRDDYGEAAYDWFLYAAGRANRVKVEGVLGGSAGSEVGIQAGDHIYSYAGERIYKPWSLVQATQSGRPGETVEVEVERGGERLRVTVPRGPIGVRIGRDTVEPPPVD